MVQLPKEVCWKDVPPGVVNCSGVYRANEPNAESLVVIVAGVVTPIKLSPGLAFVVFVSPMNPVLIVPLASRLWYSAVDKPVVA